MSAVRYKKSIEPVYTDGRDIDVEIAELSGEAAEQRASGSTDKHIRKFAQTWTELPEPHATDPTYYERPLLNEPVWEWAIPTYYYVGGLAGAALVLGAAVQLRRSAELERLVKCCHWIGFAGCCASGGLLVCDLGRPSRFLNMLRVFRPTSPMNLGAWILSATGAASSTALMLRGRRGLFGTLGESAGYISGFSGMALATYTGVLVSNSVVPVWQVSRRILPLLFGASAMASVGSAFEMFAADQPEQRVTKLFGVVGQVGEVSAAIVMEKQASIVPQVGLPLKRGLSGAMWKTATLLTATSLVISLLPGKSRRKRATAGVLGTLGSLLMRFAVERAGVASSRDARASFHQQRAETFRDSAESP